MPLAFSIKLLNQVAHSNILFGNLTKTKQRSTMMHIANGYPVRDMN